MNSEWVLETPPPSADLRSPYGADPSQFGELRLPKSESPHPRPVVVVIHGGFWRARYDLVHVGHLCADLTSRGFATWNLEYRRVGNPGGGFPGTLRDVAAGVDHLRQLATTHRLDLARVVTLGHSAGGHLAAWVASRSRVSDPSLRGPDPLRLAGMISLAGVLDLARAHALRLSEGIVGELMNGAPDEQQARYALASPIALLPNGVQQVLLHGTRDTTVPEELSLRYQAEAKRLGDDSRFVPLEGADHFELIDPKSAEWPRVVDAVTTLLGRP
jgi:acetyl esterase/lipase